MYGQRLSKCSCQTAGGQNFVVERAKFLLAEASRLGLHTRTECLEYLGSHFRVALDIPDRKSDYQAGPLLCFCIGKGCMVG